MGHLDVMYLSDNNYAPFAGVSMMSLFQNNKSVDSFTVYVIDDGISAENKDRLINLANQYSHAVVFLNMERGIDILRHEGAPTYRRSYTTYLKLFAFNELPDSVHRILFIDSDSVVVGDVGELVDFNMGGNVICAVKDGLTQKYKVALGFDEGDSWYNMGVMLVDVDAWKRTNGEQKILSQLRIRSAYVSVDQDLLNITQHGNIGTLHPKYNATPHHYVYDEKAFIRAFKPGGFYTDSAVMEEANKHAVIRHFERFVGESAWNANSCHPYAQLFDEYLAKSPWCDYPKRPAKLSLTLKIEKMLYRLLPKNAFLRIFAIGFNHYVLSANKRMVSMGLVDDIS